MNQWTPMAAILDFSANPWFYLINYYFIRQFILKNLYVDTKIVHLSWLVIEIYIFLWINEPHGGHLGFRGQNFIEKIGTKNFLIIHSIMKPFHPKKFVDNKIPTELHSGPDYTLELWSQKIFIIWLQKISNISKRAIFWIKRMPSLDSWEFFL